MRLNHIAVFTLILILLTAAPFSTQAAPSQPRIVGYFPSWSIYDRQYFVTDIPADKLTHLNYAFATISDNGEIALLDEQADTLFAYPGDTATQPLKGNFHQLQLLKAAHPNLRTLISIGGWSESGKFSDVALTPESRAKFAQSVVDFVAQYGFDGVDIDWEYPTGGGDPGNVERPEDKDNFPLLLAALRSALDSQNQHALLTIDLNSYEDGYVPLNWSAILPSLDWINLMGYDMSGDWSAVTGFNAPLDDSTINPPEGMSDNTALHNLRALGIPPDKLVLGVPFYGIGWTGVVATNHGLHQHFTGIPSGTWGEGTFDYADLAAHFVGKYQRFWDDTAQVPWLYDASSGTMISYDDPELLTRKAEFARAQGLGGVMIWELSADTRDHVLLNTLYDALLSGKGK